MFSKSFNPVSLNVFSRDTAHPANPGGGNPCDWPCPVNSRVRITNIRYQQLPFAAGFYPLVFIIPLAGPHILVSASSIAPPAPPPTFSTGFYETIYSLADDFLLLPLPDNLYLEPGETLRLTFDGIAGAVSMIDIYISYHQWIIA